VDEGLARGVLGGIEVGVVLGWEGDVAGVEALGKDAGGEFAGESGDDPATVRAS
jgi:hypothetical protein